MGGKSPDMKAANTLAALSKQMFQESNPARRAMFKQLNEALKTGGVGARIPIIQRAMDLSKQATSQAVSQTQEQLAKTPGLANTPFASRILAQQRLGGAQQAAQIPTDYAQQLISAGPGLISAGSGIPGLSAAASIQQSGANQAAQNQAMIYGGLGQAAGSVAGASLGYGGAFGQSIKTPTAGR